MNKKADTVGPEPRTRGETHSEESLKKAARNGETVDDIKEQLEEKEAETEAGGRFGTFGGVFVPTLLTILGVIMFLRAGWVVGNAGLGGAWLIIAVSFLITGCTGLSMSCFVTNIRVGSGGAFSMISQSLGLEVGGSIGIPLYLAQVLAVGMYVFGFREGWLWIFPGHAPLYVDLATFAVIFIITFVSAKLAVKVQYLILTIIIAALGSVALAAITGSMQHDITLWGNFPGDKNTGFSGVGFWYVFAVFFPASTGIMAGANMSGELRNPKHNIPLGTMAAIGLSLLIYMALAFWLARSVSTDELVRNYTVMIDHAYYGPLVLAGLLAATFSSGLVSFVGAPRILQAMAEHKIIPASGWFAKRTRGEPLNAIIVSSIITLGALMMRDLNAIAPLITMFFLVTYAAINLIVLIEQSLGLLSFRPLLQIPRFVSLIGLLGCLTVMFIINPIMGAIAMAVIVAIYTMLLRRDLLAPFGDVRSGIVMALAEWAAKRMRMMEGGRERVWKPHLLVPTEDAQELLGINRLVYELAHPSGSVKLLGINKDKNHRKLHNSLKKAKEAFQEDGIFCAASTLHSQNYAEGLRQGMEALSGTIFRPNVLFLTLPTEKSLQKELDEVIEAAEGLNLAVALFVHHPKAGLGRRHIINVWIGDHGPNWDIKMRFENLDVSLLLAYRLCQSWEGELNLIVAVDEKKSEEKAKKFLGQLSEAARLPGNTKVLVADGDFGRFSSKAPRADINFFPLGKRLDAEFMIKMRDQTDSACLFSQDSGTESALA
jgi:solute carrier family 12 (sodium/potassium/chloride transporter), member 2